MDSEDDELPLQTIDIPDPINPPSGCRFHTRCPEAREVCKQSSPEIETVLEDESGRHRAECYRIDEDHEYWDSEPLEFESALSDPDETQGAGSSADD